MKAGPHGYTWDHLRAFALRWWRIVHHAQWYFFTSEDGHWLEVLHYFHMRRFAPNRQQGVSKFCSGGAVQTTPPTGSVRVTVSSDREGRNVLASATIPYGETSATLDPLVTLEAGVEYYLTTYLPGGLERRPVLTMMRTRLDRVTAL